MFSGSCNCCGAGTEACGLDVLRAAGWSLVEHAEGEDLVLLCPVCAWLRDQATQVVTAAVEAAYGATPLTDVCGRRRGKRRGGWFWS